jgi:beta-lactamase class A
VKRNKRGIHGPKVRYFNHHFGIVNTRRPKLVTVFLPTLMTVFLIGGGFIGLSYWQSSKVAQRADDKPAAVEQKPVAEEKEVAQKPRQAREDSGLSKTIQKKLDSMPKNTKWAVSVRDLNSDRMANINADRQLEAASLYKLFLLAPLEKKISADNWKSKLGKQTIGTCVELMIKKSDNDCAIAVADYVGWKAIDSHNQTLGFKKTKLNAKDNQQTTARETADLLYRLQNSQILSDKGRRAFFDALYEQEYRYGIPTGCGQDCLVGNKTGQSQDVKHDAAIVTHGRSQYVVVIMSSGANWAQLAEVAHIIDEAMLP